MDFRDVVAPERAEQVRAWAIERAIEHLGYGSRPRELVACASLIEDYVLGDRSIAVNEMLMDVKNSVEEWFTNVDLTDLYKSRGWIDQKR